jgi:signal peptidase
MSSPGTDRSDDGSGSAGDERSSTGLEGWRSAEDDDGRDHPPSRGGVGGANSADRAGGNGGDARPGGWRLFARDLLTSVVAVMLVGAYLFAISGVWPPLVAVESESMVPNMQVNDLVFVMEENRFPGETAENGTGVVTAHRGEDYRKFGAPGDVIVYTPDGNSRRTPIIHRAMLYVEDGENWYDRADPEAVAVGSCSALANCPAPHAGFITKGDNNGRYDQATGLSGPVRAEWVVGTAEFRVPGLGWVRLQSSG